MYMHYYMGTYRTPLKSRSTESLRTYKENGVKKIGNFGLARRLRRGHGFLDEARNHLVAVGGVPNGGGDDGGVLLHIVRQDALVGVEVGVVSQDVVIDGVLRAAHARQPGVVERGDVGAASGAAVGGADAAHTEIGEIHEQRAPRPLPAGRKRSRRECARCRYPR